MGWIHLFRKGAALYLAKCGVAKQPNDTGSRQLYEIISPFYAWLHGARRQ
jgi:hypothetical protein